MANGSELTAHGSHPKTQTQNSKHDQHYQPGKIL